MYILHCPRICRSVRSVSSLVAGDEGKPAFIEPVAHRLRFVVGYLGHRRNQGRLAEPFLIDSRWIEKIVLNDRVIHPHAAFVEDAENCLACFQIARQGSAQLLFSPGQSRQIQVMHMAQVMFDCMLRQPLPQAAAKEVVLEVLAPQGTEGNSALVQAAIQIQHAHQARPLARPVSHGKDGTAMMLQSGEHVVAVLPDRFRNNDGRIRMDLREDVHAHALTGNKAVSQILVVRVRPAQCKALGPQCIRELLFHLGLCRPADLICGLAQIPAGDQQNLAGCNRCG